MTAYLCTPTESPDLLTQFPFEIEAEDDRGAARAASAWMAGWHDYIAAGGAVPHRWAFDSIERLDRPPLIAKNARRGALDADNPIVIYLGAAEIGRITMPGGWRDGSAKQEMRVEISAPFEELQAIAGPWPADSPGYVKHQVLTALRWIIGGLSR